MRKPSVAILKLFPRLKGMVRAFAPKPKHLKLKSINDFNTYCIQFTQAKPGASALDLGCGSNPRNPFEVKKLHGCDLFADKNKKILKCRLGFEKIPHKDNTFDYLSAFDLIEHIPRYSDNADINHTPFIFFMNETYRVLKKEGFFLSVTPFYPYVSAFVDPTHTNVITEETFSGYFSDKKNPELAEQYGIKTNYKIVNQRVWNEHLVTLFQK